MTRAQKVLTAVGIALISVLLISLTVAAIIGLWKVIAFMVTGVW
jgi:hypothetical protein